MDICYIITINYLTHRVAFLSFVCSERDFWLLWVLLRGPIHLFACSQPPQVHCVHPRLGKCALLRGQCTPIPQMSQPKATQVTTIFCNTRFTKREYQKITFTLHVENKSCVHFSEQSEAPPFALTENHLITYLSAIY